MKIFVTGASGWIGSAVVPELIDNGHQVIGLARSNESARKLQSAGAEVIRGTIDDIDLLKDVAASSDGVIHLAFKHDIAFSGNFAGAASADRQPLKLLAKHSPDPTNHLPSHLAYCSLPSQGKWQLKRMVLSQPKKAPA